MRSHGVAAGEATRRLLDRSAWELARPRADELKELSRQLAIEATRAETLARRAGPAAEDSVWPGRQSIETFGDEAVPVGVDDIAEV